MFQANNHPIDTALVTIQSVLSVIGLSRDDAEKTIHESTLTDNAASVGASVDANSQFLDNLFGSGDIKPNSTASSSNDTKPQQANASGEDSFRAQLIHAVSGGNMTTASAKRLRAFIARQVEQNPVKRDRVAPLPTPDAYSAFSAATSNTDSTNVVGSARNPSPVSMSSSTHNSSRTITPVGTSSDSTYTGGKPANPDVFTSMQEMTAHKFAQLVHKGWSPEIRNELLTIRHIYTAHRESLIETLMHQWRHMRLLFLKHYASIPITETNISVLDERMSRYITLQVLFLQHRALCQAFKATHQEIPPELALSQDEIYADSDLVQAVAARMARVGARSLSREQTMMLESWFLANNGCCTKAGKKRLAECTGLTTGEIGEWFEARRQAHSMDNNMMPQPNPNVLAPQQQGHITTGLPTNIGMQEVPLATSNSATLTTEQMLDMIREPIFEPTMDAAGVNAFFSLLGMVSATSQDGSLFPTRQ